MSYNPDVPTVVVYLSGTDMSKQMYDQFAAHLKESLESEHLNIWVMPRYEVNISGVSEIKFLNIPNKLEEEIEEHIEYYNTPNFEDIDRMDIDDDMKDTFKSEFRKVQINKIIK